MVHRVHVLLIPPLKLKESFQNVNGHQHQAKNAGPGELESQQCKLQK